MKLIDWVKNKTYNVDCRIGLKQLPDESVDCFISSPPYWLKREYSIEPTIWDGDPNCKHDWDDPVVNYKYSGGINKDYVGNFDSDKTHFEALSSFCKKCGAWLGCLGLESTIELFIKHLCDIYDDVKRVLKKTGTCWVNLGDTYANTGVQVNYPSLESVGTPKNKPILKDYKTKCLCLIPQRFAIEMINRGWILRNIIIWYKPNAMPESARDRFPIDYEPVLFFSKSQKYFFDREANREEISQTEVNLNRRKYKPGKNEGRYSESNEFSMSEVKDQYWSDGKYKRTMWAINTKKSPVKHYATYPPELIEPMVLAGCPERICKNCDRPLPPIYDEEPNPNRVDREDKPNVQGVSRCPTKDYSNKKTFVGYDKCDCGVGWKSGVVCDPFGGIGTTARVAIEQDRDWISFDLSEEYCDKARLLIKQKIYDENAKKIKGQGEFLML